MPAGGIVMLKSIMMHVAAIALAVSAWLLLPMRGHEAVGQSGPLVINVVEFDVVPAQFDNWMAAAQEDGAASVKEPGCREFDITVSQKDPNHVLLFAVFDNAAALDAHRATDHFKKYQATAKDMVAKRDIRQFSSISMNMKGM
jgi:autoinducer 2-degrading protein